MSDLLPANSQPPPDQRYPAYGPTLDYGPVQPPPARIQRFFIFLRRLWWVPLLTLFVCMGAAEGYVYWMPPTYVSTARMWETEKLNLPGGPIFSADLQTYLGTQIELMRSGRLRQLALERLPTNAIPLDKENQPRKVQLKIGQAPRSSVFYVEASSSDPTYTRLYLDALMQGYRSYKKTIRSELSGNTFDSIDDQVTRLEISLKDSQIALGAFRRSNDLAVLQEDARIAGAYLAKLKTDLSDLKLEQQLLDAFDLRRESTGTNNPVSLTEPVSEGRSGSVNPQTTAERQAAFKELEVLKLQRDKLSKYFRPKHPKIVKLDAEIERASAIVGIYRRQNQDQLAETRQRLEAKTASVQASIKEWEEKVTRVSALMDDFQRLKDEVAHNQGNYDQLVKMRQNVDISRNIDQETLAILEQASIALYSYRPIITVLGAGFFLGLFLGLGFVFVAEVRDDRLNTVTEVNLQVADNIVGQVPEIPALEPKKPLPLLADNDDRHMFAESYRSLRSALLFLPFEGQRPKVILVTSALPNEGKSTVAANLAQALALGGSRVLLVDADLRQGALHLMLHLLREPGLGELLRDPGKASEVIQRHPESNLAFISRGHITHNPGDLFLRPALEQILTRWRQDFDSVIIDSCPIFAADDAATLAPKVDGTLFVVRNRFSSARASREALEQLYQRQAKVLGLIFNRADSSAGSYQYYKYGEYAGPKSNNSA
jgi:polysaccharide biosynthesis transport protein